ncbi:hypothetical protein Clacol_000825 [Clathrus columnatus]|uniref:NAD(P)-binding protein n=1 Tax=Clathrus columnatus TaxID=1419009 RepID=A0AAV4ZX71_9AGAM|nr:hypothetical protein Clacol_000825 [Clathrus columnatus]
MILGLGSILENEPPEVISSKGQALVEKARKFLSTVPRSGRLKDKVCIITGIGKTEKGIGFATAVAYAHAGAKHLYLLDLVKRPLDGCKAIIAERYPDVKVTTIEGDAADETTISGLCNHVLKEERRLDVFFANAGISYGSELHHITTEMWLNTMRINTLSVFLATKYGSTAMMKTDPTVGKEASSGSIILTASIAGLRACGGPVECWSDFLPLFFLCWKLILWLNTDSASKAAVISVAQTASYQLARTNIRINAICPGLIETDMTQIFWDQAHKQNLTVPALATLNPLMRQGASEGTIC